MNPNFEYLKANLIEAVVDTGNDKYIEMSSPSSDSSISSWDLSSLSDMDVDQDLIEEEEKLLSGDQDIDAMEQLNRDKFIKMFKDKLNYPSINSIAVSDKLSWSRSKFFRIYDHYLEEREFQNDKRKDSKSPKRKLKDEYLMAILSNLLINLKWRFRKW